MISITKYLFENKDENTKLHWAEKTAGTLGIAGGLGAAAGAQAAKYVNKDLPTATNYKTGNDIIDDLANDVTLGGLATAGAIGAGLGAHKLYKMYKAKKNKEIQK